MIIFVSFDIVVYNNNIIICALVLVMFFDIFCVMSLVMICYDVVNKLGCTSDYVLVY